VACHLKPVVFYEVKTDNHPTRTIQQYLVESNKNDKEKWEKCGKLNEKYIIDYC